MDKQAQNAQLKLLRERLSQVGQEFSEVLIPDNSKARTTGLQKMYMQLLYDIDSRVRAYNAANKRF